MALFIREVDERLVLLCFSVQNPKIIELLESENTDK